MKGAAVGRWEAIIAQIGLDTWLKYMLERDKRLKQLRDEQSGYNMTSPPEKTYES